MAINQHGQHKSLTQCDWHGTECCPGWIEQVMANCSSVVPGLWNVVLAGKYWLGDGKLQAVTAAHFV